ncbi:hypothetical protein ACX0HA_00165 [Flavobacterium hauense]
MKQIVQRLPELFFMSLGAYWVSENYLASAQVNWIALIFIVLLAVQLFLQHRIAGMALGLVIGLICAYMLFAVLSEFKQFKTINDEALQLLAFGVGIFGLGVVSATAMVYKFVIEQQNYMRNEHQLTA